MMMKRKTLLALAGLPALLLGAQDALASCADVSRQALTDAVATAAAAKTGGYGLPMWVSVVDETGKVCHVVNSSGTGSSNDSWLGSRNISMQKANTANAFSIDGYAISTANLYSAVQPGGSLFGLQASNPVDATKAFGGAPVDYGTANDPLRGQRIGGVNVFGGGLALYKNAGTVKLGAVGVSGDTSCRDHAFAWRVRAALNAQPAGTGITTVNMNAAGTVQAKLAGAVVGDEMIIDANGTSNYWDAWSQPACPNSTGLGAAANTANGVILN
jgi:uncharacterized protein GlcG (DUF336 family)